MLTLILVNVMFQDFEQHVKSHGYNSRQRQNPGPGQDFHHSQVNLFKGPVIIYDQGGSGFK